MKKVFIIVFFVFLVIAPDVSFAETPEECEQRIRTQYSVRGVGRSSLVEEAVQECYKTDYNFDINYYLPSDESQGACSYHGGVSCNVGADWDGSVICNDGWMDSTVLYENVEKCKEDEQYDPVKIARDFSDKAIMDSIHAYIQYGEYGCIVISTYIKILLDKVDIALDNEKYYQEKSKEYTSAYYFNLAGDELKAADIYLKTSKNLTENYYAVLCVKEKECSANEKLENDSCYCDEGYYRDAAIGDCVTIDQWCVSKYGTNMEVKDNECVCKEGFTFDSTTSQCVTYSKACKNTCGIGSYSKGIEDTTGGYYCYCKEGFVWSGDKTECIEKAKEKVNTQKVSVDFEVDVSPFKDINEFHKNKEAILFLYNEGIIKGYSDGTFQPEKSINRAELLKILVEGKNIKPPLESNNNCFEDVAEEWFAPYVCYSKTVGWINGYSDGTFKPSQLVNRAEAIKMLLNSQNVEIPENIYITPFNDIDLEDWFAPFVYRAKELGILEDSMVHFFPALEMKRSNLCESLYRLLNTFN